jgi:hypothetical protein
MNSDVDTILGILRQFSNSSKEEFVEQEGEASADTGGGATGGGTSSASPVKKWESGRTMGKTYGGPGYKWESGRTMGKTYGGSGYKWFTGLTRGHANPAKES